MEQIYALGVAVIEYVQHSFSDYEQYLGFVNTISNPKFVVDFMVPLVSIVDSVFSAQLLLCMGYGGWLNTIVKWFFLEDRPYWWVRETSFYTHSGLRTPALTQTRQTCETGPGSPSGHTTTSAMLLLLVIMWTKHIIRDRNLNVYFWPHLVYAFFGFTLGSVIVARMYVATHFPHQCLLGALIGAVMAPALCIYVSDPYIWRYNSKIPLKHQHYMHIAAAIGAMFFGFVVYFGLCLLGMDPHYTVKLAFRWCRHPDSIHVTTTPMFSLIQTSATIIGWSFFVSPEVAKYRHDTKGRSLLISSFATSSFMYLLYQVEMTITRENTACYYGLQFLLNLMKPLVYLRLIPTLALWPYKGSLKMKKE